MSDIKLAVKRALDRGSIPLPVRAGEKATRLDKWSDPETKPGPEAFSEGDNIAERLDHVVDIDPDCLESRIACEELLLSTPRKHGRPSVGTTHFWFIAPGLKYEKFTDVPQPDPNSPGKMITPSIIEIRAGRTHYTLIPPSRVPVKDAAGNLTNEIEELVWHDDVPPATVDPDGLRRSVAMVATAALMGRHWPNGSRHDAALHLAGFLAARKLDPKEIISIVCTAARIAHDEEVPDRERAARTSIAAFASGKKTTGAPSLEPLVGKDVVARLLEWWNAHGDALVLDPQDPMPSARIFVQRHHTIDGTLALRHQAGVFYAYEQSASAYYERDEPSVRAELYSFLESAKRRGDEDKVATFKPTKSKVENVLDSLRAVCNLPTSRMPPCWLTSDRLELNPIDMLACANGLVHIPTRTLHPATPEFFTLNGLEFGFDQHAPAPVEWLGFLRSVWPDDQEAIDTLQEMFGYFLTPDTRFQKISLIVGPKRSGKGTIARVLRALVGARNMCSPTLASFGRDFGKQVLVGKTLAVMSDARISGRTDSAAVAETLLSISGEDAQTVERKFLPDWSGKLAVRFLILANELPRIGDASGALASRLIVLVMKHSFFGKEDLALFDRIVGELPGILNWALEGRDRLYARGFFVQPQSANDVIQEFMDLSSPEGAFIKERCDQVQGAEVDQKELFEDWKLWCATNGHTHTGTSQTFARGLRAMLPWLDSVHRRTGNGDERERRWVGLRLKAPVANPKGDLPF